MIKTTMDESYRIPHITVTIDENELTTGALKVLDNIRPAWSTKNIMFKLLTDGITNKLIACNQIGAPEEETVLVRVYGNKTDLLIDREAETRNIINLNNVGLAPKLYATFHNGLAYEFVPGCTLTEKTVTEPKVYLLVATRMAHLHQIKVPNEPILWCKLRNFLDLVPQRFSDKFKQEKFEKTIVSKSKIQREIDFLEEKLSKLGSPVVFSHNDLLLANVIYTADKKQVTFIDFEYAAPNYQAFDIGNHFAEFAGVDSVDYSKYPSKEFQWNWLRAYLYALHEDDVSERDIQKLHVQVNQFSLASHVFWGLWALIQAEHSTIDFDFMKYASIRFGEYFAKKDLFLSLNLPR